MRALRQASKPSAGDGPAPSPSQRLLMWRAAADMMVVHHPGWLSPKQTPETSFSFHEGDSAGGPCGGPEDVAALLLGIPPEARAAGALAARAPAAAHGSPPGPGWRG